MSNETYDVYHVWLTDRSDPDFVDGDKLMWVDDDSFPVEVYSYEDGDELFGGRYVFHSDLTETGQESRIEAEAEKWQKAAEAAGYLFEWMDEDGLANFCWGASHVGYLVAADDEFESIYELLRERFFLYQESGIVCFPDSMEAVVCNWSSISGVPRIFADGIPIGLGEAVVASGDCETVGSWRDFVSEYDVVYDANGDMVSADDCEACVVMLDSGQVVVVPDGWE